MKKYFNSVLIVEIICIAYTIIHDYYFISLSLMLLAAALMFIASIYLYWQCFTNKKLTKKQKISGLIVASIPVIVVIGWLIFIAIILALGVH
jgi:hypothetical protein